MRSRLLTEINPEISGAKAAIEQGEAIRARLRRKSIPGGIVRQELLNAAISDLQECGATLRSLIGSSFYYDLGRGNEKRLKAASKACAAERRKLRKMLR